MAVEFLGKGARGGGEGECGFRLINGACESAGTGQSDVARCEGFEFSTSDVANWRCWPDRALPWAAMGRVCGAWIEHDAGLRERVGAVAMG